MTPEKSSTTTQDSKAGNVTDTELGHTSSREGDTTVIGVPAGDNGVDTAGFHRRLNKRQIMFMTFGAGIGTGLWVGTGTALKAAGPGGIAVAYTFQA